jgi:hypothetical protein
MIYAAIAPQTALRSTFGNTLGSHSFLIAVCAIWNSQQFHFAHYTFDTFKRSRAAGMQGSAPLARPPPASEGMRFTDYYAEPKCTAGRGNFTTDGVPDPHGLATAGQVGSPLLPDHAPTIVPVNGCEPRCTLSTHPIMWKAFIMKAELWLDLIVLKNAIDEIERDITILEEQRQLTRHIQIGGQLAFGFHETLAALPK